MKNYMESWNEIIEYVEGISADIIEVMDCSYLNEEEKENEVKYMLAIYSLMILNNFSRKL